MGTRSSERRTWTKTTAASCSAASSTPNSTASWEAGEPSVATRIFLIGCLLFLLDSCPPMIEKTRAPAHRGRGRFRCVVARSAATTGRDADPRPAWTGIRRLHDRLREDDL